ncbi:hypothetical protein BCR39DRAFT_50499 [Naematelia encephala]|uniref:Uncharacterized protein n=1 Tax=Naematelia encephala TaxID=71784 RepID=A0A1Y2AH49_9TREE|nr:hypothetical protein BCR39DRAFT_50499 [Naematelia encephala]
MNVGHKSVCVVRRYRSSLERDILTRLNARLDPHAPRALSDEQKRKTVDESEAVQEVVALVEDMTSQNTDEDEGVLKAARALIKSRAQRAHTQAFVKVR